jgi:hypothetical protein
MGTLVDERTFDQRLPRLEAVAALEPTRRVAVRALIRTDDDAAVFRINPFTFASERA